MKQAIKRRLTGLVLSAILLAALALPAFAADIPAAPSGHAVLDQAGVLSQETINTVDGYNNALSSTGAQIAVLTVDFTGNLSIDDYALQVFNEWGIGDKKKQNGVLFLLVTGDQNAYCTIGTGLEGEITYSRIKQLLEDYARDGVKSGNYDDAVVQFTGAMYSELCSLYGITPGEGQPQPKPVEQDDSDLSGVLLMLLIAAVLIILIIGTSGRGGGRGGPGGGGGGRGRDVVFWPLFLGGWGRPRYYHRPYHRPPPGGFGDGFGGPGGFGGGGFGGGGFGGGGGGFGGFGGGGSRGGGAGLD
ncbi:TPM domain-containing protein [Fournierella sp.]|uniref:TPM domain-containing protein n=1 Tax=Allofournierella sp. TaxID=1940256 RepID=UPI0025C3E23D|nr:TPM domain-containing protein [Fournierella sp.]